MTRIGGLRASRISIGRARNCQRQPKRRSKSIALPAIKTETISFNFLSVLEVSAERK
ncbi:MAG: hypothetical protein HC786_23420 [Richelia sp. CSU_2_1]|nr:hypothetical protein [Richelia sp. CSU_2_1]